MGIEQYLPTGEWRGFYLEWHRSDRGWMHLYLAFEAGRIVGEGTDYVGPWTAMGRYDVESGCCQWTKQYVGKHKVQYEGNGGPDGIRGRWRINLVGSGDFHIWPAFRGDLEERYLEERSSLPESTMPLGTVPVDDPFA